MKKTFVRLVVVALVAIFAPLSGLNAQEVEKSKQPTVDLRKVEPSEVIKLDQLDERAIGYLVKSTWKSHGYHFALAFRIAQMDIKYSPDGKVGVTTKGSTEPIIVLIPMNLPIPGQAGYSPYIKLEGGKVGILNPATGKVTFYE